MDIIKCQDFEIIIKYAMVYGLANERGDILKQCNVLRGRAMKRGPDGSIPLDEADGAAFGSLCLYAVASAGSADDAVAGRVCRTASEHSGLFTQDDRALAMAVTDMLRDKQKEMECPFYQLHEYLKKEDAGVQARENEP